MDLVGKIILKEFVSLMICYKGLLKKKNSLSDFNTNLFIEEK